MPLAAVSIAGGFPELAVLHWKKEQQLLPEDQPDFYAEITEDFIHYPWQRIDDSDYRVRLPGDAAVLVSTAAAPHRERIAMSQPSALTAASSAEARIPEILRLLHQEYPDATCELDFRSPLELLVATILSAQCTDERANKVTPAPLPSLRRRRPTPRPTSRSLQEAVRPTGFFRNKSKNIQGAARRIVEAYDGAVLSVMDDLVSHCRAWRVRPPTSCSAAPTISPTAWWSTPTSSGSPTVLGLTAESNPEKIERDLMNLVPQEE